MKIVKNKKIYIVLNGIVLSTIIGLVGTSTTRAMVILDSPTPTPMVTVTSTPIPTATPVPTVTPTVYRTAVSSPTPKPVYKRIVKKTPVKPVVTKVVKNMEQEKNMVEEKVRERYDYSKYQNSQLYLWGKELKEEVAQNCSGADMTKEERLECVNREWKKAQNSVVKLKDVLVDRLLALKAKITAISSLTDSEKAEFVQKLDGLKF